MFAEVIPSVILPREKRGFFYFVPPELEKIVKIGSVVIVPWRNRQVFGMILSLQNDIHLDILKNIKPISLPNNGSLLLDENQRNLIFSCATYYGASPSTILFSFLPHLSKRKTPSCETSVIRPSALQGTKKTSPYHWEKMNSAQNTNIALFRYRSFDDKCNLYLSIIEANDALGKLTLLLVPELSEGKAIANRLSSQTNVTLCFGQMSKKQYMSAWNAINDGKRGLVIGTKISIFSPWKNLGCIIVDREECDAHKQWDQYPRMDTRKIALMLSEIHNCPILFSSHLPRIETYYLCLKGKARFLQTQEKRRQYAVHNILLRREKMSLPYFSEAVLKTINKNRDTGHKTVILLNTTGFARSIYCGDCRNTLVCSICRKPFVLPYENAQQLFCHFCKTLKDTPASCPVCGGNHFRFRGKGLHGLAFQMRQALPHVSIALLDKGTEAASQSRENAHVILATFHGGLQISWKGVSSVIILCLEQELNYPDYRSAEKTLQLLFEIEAKAVSESELFQELLIQTFAEEHPVVKAFTEDDIKSVYLKELAQRKKLLYPPFSRLITLSFKLKHETQEKSSIFGEISSIMGTLKTSEKIDIIGPKTTKQRTHEIVSFFIRFPFEEEEHISKALSTLKSDWKIDRDPIELI